MPKLTREESLELALQGLLDALNAAMDVGCLEHTDAWEDAEDKLWNPMNVAEKLLNKKISPSSSKVELAAHNGLGGGSSPPAGTNKNDFDVV